MTREKAIEIINYHKILVDRDKSGLLDKKLEYEAIDMAIKALEQEPTAKNDLGVEEEEIYDRGYADGQQALAEHIRRCKAEKEPKTGHCRDCKYYHTAWDGTETHYYTDYWCEWVEPNENDFCSLYEPKEGVSE